MILTISILYGWTWRDLELQVLKSSPKILGKVKVIYTETNFLEFSKEMTQYKDFLERFGFQMLSHWYAEGFKEMLFL